MCQFSMLQIKPTWHNQEHIKTKSSPKQASILVSVIFVSCFIILLGQFPSVVSGESNHPEETEGIHIASWNWDHVGVFITVTTFIVLSGLAKVGKNAIYALVNFA